MRKTLLAIAFAIVLVTTVGMGAAHAEPITVCPAPGKCDYTTIQDAVDHAKRFDIITIGVRDVFTETGIIIRDKQNITIRGLDPNDTKLQASDVDCPPGAQRIFTIDRSIVTIENMNIRNGCSVGDKNVPDSGQGGGIWSSGNLILRNVLLSNNRAVSGVDDVDVFGGALYSIGSVVIDNTTFQDNTATSGKHAYGGAWYNNAAAKVINSTFSGNKADGNSGQGGAVYNDYTLTLGFTSILSNTASLTGGGLYNNGRTETRNGVVAHNTAGVTEGFADCFTHPGLDVSFLSNNTKMTSSDCGVMPDSHLTFKPLGVVRPGYPPVYMPLMDSSVVGTGDCSDNGLSEDQLDQPRSGINCTIGAVELPRMMLPVVMSPALADLQVVDLRVSPASGLRAGSPVMITVVVQNTGGLIADKNFWVDLYINPTIQPPNASNNSQTWRDLCHTVPIGYPVCYYDQGISWQVSDYLHPGESVTLTSARENLYFQPAQSNWGGSFNRAEEKHIWAFVDSWGGPGKVGGYIDELPNGESNNLSKQIVLNVASNSVAAAQADLSDGTPLAPLSERKTSEE